MDTRSGELAGCCGVDDWSKADVAQVGYWIATNARGRGYATRAAVLLTRWLFELGAARVFLTIVAGNEGSIAVARRAGFVFEGRCAHTAFGRASAATCCGSRRCRLSGQCGLRRNKRDAVRAIGPMRNCNRRLVPSDGVLHCDEAQRDRADFRSANALNPASLRSSRLRSRSAA
jgi:Acetyltransferase (GNAT) domain